MWRDTGKERMDLPLTPKRDQHLISPYNITPWSNIKVKRIKRNDQQLKFLIVTQILHVSALGNIREQYGEYAYWC